MATYLDLIGGARVLRKTIQTYVSGQFDRLISTSNRGVVHDSLIQLPGARVTGGSSQALVSGTPVVLSFDTVIFSDEGMWQSATPTRLYAPSEGIYVIGASVAIAANATGFRDLRIRRNGAGLLSVVRYPAFSGVAVLSVCEPVRLGGGDYIEALANQNSGVSLNTVVAAEYSPGLWLQRVSSYLGV